MPSQVHHIPKRLSQTFVLHEIRSLERLGLDIRVFALTDPQESLRNAVKHAGRTHVRVELRGDPEGLWLIISDAGKGFDSETHR